MIGLDSNFSFNFPQASEPSLFFDIKQNLEKQAYCLTFEVYKDQGVLIASLSDCSILCLDINTMKCLKHIPQAHSKRINDLCLNDNMLYTCSNDGTVKIWDLKSDNPLVNQCKGSPKQEFYSLAQIQHILAGGSDSDILFWDLRQCELLNTFNETHSDEVTSLQFAKESPSILMSSSLDGLVCLFDLSKDNEEDASDTIIRLEQPINKCRFIGDGFNFAYAQTTVQTIALLSFENAKMVKEVNTIENLDTNSFALLDAYSVPSDSAVYYLRGNLEGYIEEYGINLLEDSPVVLSNKFNSEHKGPLTKAQRISDEYIISSGEDCKVCVTQKSKNNQLFDLEQIQKNMFLEDDATTDSSNHYGSNGSNRRKQKEFNPFN